MYNLHVCKFDHEHAQTIKFSFLLLLFFLAFSFTFICLTIFCFSFRSIIPILCLYQSLLFSCLSLCTISSSHCVSFSVFPFSYEEDISQSVCAGASFTFRYFFFFFFFICFYASGQKQQASVESAISQTENDRIIIFFS